MRSNATIGIIVVAVLVALVVYFVMDERDNDIEIDLGAHDVPVSVIAG